MPSICHLTILNPAIHSRIFYKLALSQASMGFDVSIIGQSSKRIPFKEGEVMIYPLPIYNRLSVKRLMLPWRILVKAIRAKADIYTLHTPELLWVGWVLGRVFGKKLIYDVHEDYAKNIEFAGYYAKWMRKILKGLLLWNYRLFLPSMDAVSYAEISYDDMLKVGKKQSVVLRNSFSSRGVGKAKGTTQMDLPSKPYLLFSGTIAAQWGIWESLELWQKLKEVKDIAFVVAGFTYNKELLREIDGWVNERGLQNDFHLIGGSNYVPYRDIIYLLKGCYASLGLYRLEVYIQGKIPTKFYEAMAFNKPLIFSKDSYWEGLNEKWKMGIAYSEDLKGGDVINMLQSYEEKKETHPISVYSWEEDEKRLQEMLKKLMDSA